MELAYSIELPANQESVSIGDVQSKVAKTIHPDGCEFWEGREALFDRTVFIVWSRVSLEFPGEARAAKEVASILNTSNESKVMDLLPQLSGNHFYQIYLAAVHGRLLHRAIASGEVVRLEHNPTGTVAFDPLAEAAEMVIKSEDRISIMGLAKYLKRFHIGLKKVSDAGTGGLVPDRRERQAEGMPEIRGRLILKHLALLGYDPLNMGYEDGKAAAKCAVRERIWELQLQEFIHRTKGSDRASFDNFFKKAWEWLSKNNLIDNQKIGV